MLISACSQKSIPDHFEIAIPATFDSLPNFRADNQLTEARIALGKKLFFDTLLSADGSISCASCHKPGLAYADSVPVSSGVHGRLDNRNSPSLINVAWQKHLFREGGIPSLELQALAPFVNENEMNFTLTQAAASLSADNTYRRMANAAYGTTLGAYEIARALAAFQRSLISTGSAYDAYMLGDTTAISAAAIKGMKLFFSESASCSSCHTGFLFTDQNFYNIGLYETYADEGRGRFTRKEADLGKMKTPSLRNVAITAPYMHDGSIATLDQVLIFFNQGGHLNENKDARIRPLGMSAADLDELREFLASLTDQGY